MSRPRPVPRTITAALFLCLAAGTSGPLHKAGEEVSTATVTAALPGLAIEAPPEAAAALRAGDCDRAKAELAAASEARDAIVLAGLFAHSCSSHSSSLRHQLDASGYRGPLADWRLRTLAESATALGQLAIAQEALTELVTEHAGSPLAEGARAEAVELALERGDLEAARRLIARGRKPESDANRGRLEAATWRLAKLENDEDRLADSARRLLVTQPELAAELEVVELFRRGDGEIDWAELLSAGELVTRADSLAAAGLLPAAVDTLELVPEADRDGEWCLRYAEVLTNDRRGAEALDSLHGRTADEPADAARLEWARARAALEASIARRGRGVSWKRRREMRQLAHQHLRHVVSLAADRDLTRQALKVLFADRLEEERFEEALEMLRALRRLDPRDLTGAAHLWQLGWREFEQRSPSSAIGYWAELRELYPDSRTARRALYWSARAHGELGDRDRSQELLRQVVAAPVSDFYHRHATERLSVAPPRHPEASTIPPRPWPRDLRLERARWLSEAGLDSIARAELELLADHADPVAARALLAEILARQGRRRQSIVELRRAFPELGTERQRQAPAEALRLYYPLDFRTLVTGAAERYDLSPHLVFAMIRQESAFDAGAHSHAGARGLMQVMPATGRELAGKLGLPYSRGRLADPGFSVEVGTAYYRQILLSLGDEELALAGYNAGPSRIRRLWARHGDWVEVDRFVENLPFEETRTYVKRVVLLANSYRELYEG